MVSGDTFLIEKYLVPQVADLKDGRPIMAAYAVTEPGAGSDVSALQTTAVRDGDNWILNGNKMWITNAGVADWYFVVAYTDQSAGYKGMTAFIVERDWDGVSIGAKEKNLGRRAPIHVLYHLKMLYSIIIFFRIIYKYFIRHYIYD